LRQRSGWHGCRPAGRARAPGPATRAPGPAACLTRPAPGSRHRRVAARGVRAAGAAAAGRTALQRCKRAAPAACGRRAAGVGRVRPRPAGRRARVSSPEARPLVVTRAASRSARLPSSCRLPGSASSVQLGAFARTASDICSHMPCVYCTRVPGLLLRPARHTLNAPNGHAVYLTFAVRCRGAKVGVGWGWSTRAHRLRLGSAPTSSGPQSSSLDDAASPAPDPARRRRRVPRPPSAAAWGRCLPPPDGAAAPPLVGLRSWGDPCSARQAPGPSAGAGILSRTDSRAAEWGSLGRTSSPGRAIVCTNGRSAARAAPRAKTVLRAALGG